jgi:hypothetical protein
LAQEHEKWFGIGPGGGDDQTRPGGVAMPALLAFACRYPTFIQGVTGGAVKG